MRALLTIHCENVLQLKRGQMLGGCLLGELEGDAALWS